MSFRVVWMQGPKAIGSRNFDDLEAATRYAEVEMLTMQKRFGITAVKVIGSDGRPYFLRTISRG